MNHTAPIADRIDELASELIRTRARLLQMQREVAQLRLQADSVIAATLSADVQDGIVPLAVLERRAIEYAVRIKGVVVAAQLLGCGKTTVYRKLKEYGWDLRTITQIQREEDANVAAI